MDLTPRQRQVLDFIQSFAGKQGYPPTVREIAGHFGIDYRAAFDHLRALEKKGSLTRSSKSRGIQVFRPFSAVQRIPVVGKVAAGPPLEAVENIEGAIPVPEEWAKGSGLFIVRVDREGMSMSPTILPQDYLLVQQGASGDDGAIVLAMIDGEVTVKRLFREENLITLKSDNPAMPPIRVKKGREEFSRPGESSRSGLSETVSDHMKPQSITLKSPQPPFTKGKGEKGIISRPAGTLCLGKS